MAVPGETENEKTIKEFKKLIEETQDQNNKLPRTKRHTILESLRVKDEPPINVEREPGLHSNENEMKIPENYRLFKILRNH